MKRLRDYPWNVRLGAVIAAVALIAGSVVVSAKAEAATAQVSVAKARGEIVRYFGPGTVVTKCKQFSPRLVGCDYETSLKNVGIEAGSGPWSPWKGWATIDRRGVHATGIE